MTFENVLKDLQKRLELLTSDSLLSYRERLSIISHAIPESLGGAKPCFDKHLHHDLFGDKYFKIKGDKIYFGPEYRVTDYEYFLSGVNEVLAETYVFPRIFSKHVSLKKGDICIDAGANIGTMSLLFSKMVGKDGLVISVEPIVHHVLRKNARSNHRKNIVVAPVALLDRNGEIEMLISDYSLDSTVEPRAKYDPNQRVSHFGMRRKVKCTTIDNLVQEMKLPKVDFIKMDIEGSEELALNGARNVLSTYKPKLSISSYHLDHLNQKQHRKLVRILESYDYNTVEEDEAHIFAW
jgi:FkbM family methyltransferase